jgi:hypothetical protein
MKRQETWRIKLIKAVPTLNKARLASPFLEHYGALLITFARTAIGTLRRISD